MIKNKFSFNVWPAFTDLMLSLVLVMLIILFVVSKIIAAGSENLDQARQQQQLIETQIKQQLEPRYKVLLSTDNRVRKEIADIYIIDKLDRQTITFSDKVLFDSGESSLKPAGYELLNVVGPIIAKHLDSIVEIQIQGHADISYEDEYNLLLASQRAISVYNFLQHAVGIEPAKYLMSATSFGKYKPVGREAGMAYDYERLQEANSTEALKAGNRRIEIVLFFKNQKSS